MSEPHDHRRIRPCSEVKYALAERNISLPANCATRCSNARFSASMSVVGRVFAFAGVGIGLADPVPQRLVMPDGAGSAIIARR
ncbi:hypothetical protein IU469_30385 [Nocardia puris]|uniref:hypothetical protein n=1 Tax=Nocardia puris TaxID=208602 RepID=UPI001893750B|nr:hypothetical protein [Nocardia puris]MBF6215395.1 hypothetical protein [Nocardia puris]MBF6369985.1 hypothetical protein [Nocardia puris]